MDDAELVRQVLQGNRGAYGELVKRYTGQVAAVCRAHVPRQTVEDLVQETFLRGLDKLADLREAEKFGAWLYGIARNLCRDWLNNRENQHGPLDDAADRLLTPEDARGDRIGALKKCVGCLPVELREVVEIYYSGGGLTYDQLAHRLGVSRALVNKWLTQARKRLRVCLEGEESLTSVPA